MSAREIAIVVMLSVLSGGLALAFSIILYYSNFTIRGKQFVEITHRLRKGFWCEHVKRVEPPEIVAEGQFTLNFKVYNTWRNLQRRTDGTGWEMIDCGMRQMRQCSQCGYTEFR